MLKVVFAYVFVAKYSHAFSMGQPENNLLPVRSFNFKYWVTSVFSIFNYNFKFPEKQKFFCTVLFIKTG
jgi:hypothetical protein